MLLLILRLVLCMSNVFFLSNLCLSHFYCFCINPQDKRGEWDLNPRVLSNMGLAIPRPTRLGDPRSYFKYTPFKKKTYLLSFPYTIFKGICIDKIIFDIFCLIWKPLRKSFIIKINYFKSIRGDRT